MTEYKDIHASSEEAANALIVGTTTVYVHENVRKVALTDEEGNELEDQYEWIYDEKQYSKDEYIKLMANKGNSTADVAEGTRADVDYLMLLSDVDF